MNGFMSPDFVFYQSELSEVRYHIEQEQNQMKRQTEKKKLWGGKVGNGFFYVELQKKMSTVDESFMQ